MIIFLVDNALIDTLAPDLSAHGFVAVEAEVGIFIYMTIFSV